MADVSIDLLTVSGSRYYYYGQNVTYSGNTPSINGELWSGQAFTNSPATQVQEIAPTLNNFNNSTGTTFIVPAGGNSVWFNADDFGDPNNASRPSLWISNGTTTGNPVGTRIVVSGSTDAAANPTGPQGPNRPYAAASTPNTVYFAAGGTLFRSAIGADQAGTDLNTRPLSTNVGFGFGSISNITVVQGGVFFVANGTSLYFSDGTTTSGAVLVGNFFGGLSNFTASGNRLYFTNGGTQLLTATSTVLPLVPTVTQVNAATTLANISSLVVNGTQLYFSATSAAGGHELWVSVNQAEPTQVTDIQAGAANSLNVPTDTASHIGVANLAPAGFPPDIRIFFGANDLAVGEVLNSIPAGGSAVTKLPEVIRPTTASSNARDFIVVDVDTYAVGIQPALFFFSDVGPMRSVISAVTTNPGSPSGNVTLTSLDVYRDWTQQYYDDYMVALQQIDTPSPYLNFGEYLPSNFSTGIFKAGDTATANFSGYLGRQYLFFAGQTSERTTGTPSFYYTSELYVMDVVGDVNGDFQINALDSTPVRIGDIRVATPSAQGNAKPGYLTSIGNNADGNSTFVVFAASDGPTTGSLWKVTTAATQPGAFPLTEISQAAVNPRYLQSLGGGQGTGGKIYFTAGAEGNRTAWVTDGFTATQLSTAIVDESAGDGKIFGFSNGKVYFSAREPNANTDNFELYQTDHASGATALFAEINKTTTPGIGLRGSRPGNFTDVNGILYFAANDGVNGFELWSTDGVNAPAMVKTLDANGQVVDQIRPGAAGSNPGVVITTETDTDLNGVTTTRTVYTYEGFTIGNTRPDEFGVRNAGVNAAVANPAKPNSGDDTGTPTLIFAATTTQFGRELWQVTPNSFSTTVLQTINGVPNTPVTYTGNAGFAELVKDIAPGSRSSNPKNLTTIDGTVFFSADDGLSGDTLWESVGLDQLTGNTLTLKVTDDGSLFSGIRRCLTAFAIPTILRCSPPTTGR